MDYKEQTIQLISKFSKRIGISPEVIGYYTSQNIIDPIKDGDTPERYYFFHQSREIYDSIKYINLGYSIKDAAHLINGASPDEIRTALHHSKAELERKANLVELQRKEVERAITLMESFSEDDFTVENTPGYYFLPHILEHKFLEFSEEDIEILKEWQAVFPIAKQCTIHALPTDPTNMDAWKTTALYHGLIIDEKSFRLLGLHATKDTIYIPVKKCIKRIIKVKMPTDNTLDAAKELNNELLNRLFGGLLKSGVTFAGDVMGLLQLFTMEDGMRTMYFESYIPIKYQ